MAKLTTGPLLRVKDVTVDFQKPKKLNFALIRTKTTPMGFEPTRAEHIGLAVQRLNLSATASPTTTPLILGFNQIVSHH